MDEGIAASRYWCHMCSQIVDPIMEIDIKCPFCRSGFIEEVGSGSSNNDQGQIPDSELGSDRAHSLWAPILLGMMGSQRPHGRRFRRTDFVEEDNDDENHDDLEGELESIIMRRRRRRSSTAILQLLQGLRAGLQSESENIDNDRERERDRRDRDRERERVILINPFDQTIVVQGSYDGQSQNHNHTPIRSLGDYFIGPGLDLLLQHLAENDPNRYGTPPAQKEAVEAIPNVEIEETLQCSVCLDDFEIGTQAKEMPCKHKFHSQCILPWLELHSSCPVCRYQLPAAVESKIDSERYRNSSNQRETEHPISDRGSHGTHGTRASSEEGGGEERNESGRRFSLPWPFNGLFSSSSSQSGGNNSTSTSSSQSGSANE